MGHTPVSRAAALARLQQRRREWLQENGPCKICGSWDRLEVDHVEPAAKSETLKRYHTNSIWSWSGARRIAELAKCQALCESCHKKKHQSRHGSDNRYATGCRCEACRSAHADRIRAYRSRRALRNQISLDVPLDGSTDSAYSRKANPQLTPGEQHGKIARTTRG